MNNYKIKRLIRFLISCIILISILVAISLFVLNTKTSSTSSTLPENIYLIQTAEGLAR